MNLNVGLVSPGAEPNGLLWLSIGGHGIHWLGFAA